MQTFLVPIETYGQTFILPLSTNHRKKSDFGSPAFPPELRTHRKSANPYPSAIVPPPLLLSRSSSFPDHSAFEVCRQRPKPRVGSRLLTRFGFDADRPRAHNEPFHSKKGGNHWLASEQAIMRPKAFNSGNTPKKQSIHVPRGILARVIKAYHIGKNHYLTFN